MFFLLLWSTTLMSQVMGKVEDANGTALPFVNIYIEGTYLGTTSNDDGKYELNLNIKGDY
ncbi:MAG: hypothetical protein HKN96_11725, partial [Flavobacteriaceae bacterium]|nr:hypothetical protein [Flavobacteriaceae bacterium]